MATVRRPPDAPHTATPSEAGSAGPSNPDISPAQHFAAIVDSADDAIVSKRLDGTVQSWNKAAERIFGYTAEEMHGQSILRLIPPERHAEELQIMERILRGERVRHYETERLSNTGQRVAISLTVSPITDEHGRVVGASTVAREIVQEKEAERARGHLAAIIDSAADAIISKSLDGTVRSWNKAAERIFGYTAEEMLGQPILRIIPPDRHAEELQIIDSIKRGQRVDHFETLRVAKDGHLVPVSLTVSPVRDAQGRVIGASKIARDVSERDRIETALRISEARYRSLVELLPAALYTCDAEGRITFFNRRAAELWGLEPQLGDRQQRFCAGYRLRYSDGSPMSPEQTPMAVALRSGKPARNQEVIIEHPDGTQITVAANIDLLHDDEGRLTGAINVFQDMTSWKQAEAALRASEARERARATELQTIMETVPAVVFIAQDPDCRDITANRAGYELLRLPYGINASKTAKPEEIPTNFTVLQDGVELLPEQLPVQRAARGEQIRDFEEELRFDDGSTRHLLGNAVPLRDEHGRLRGAVAAFVDITERKQAEQTLREQAAQLSNADRHKNDFLAVLGHELRNPLAPISNAVHLLRMKRGQDDQARWAADLIERQLRQLTRLVDDLLDISRISRGMLELRREPIDLAELIGRALETAEPLIEARQQRLQLSLPAEPVVLSADPSRLVQVIGNLLTNAAKYTPDRGHIWVSAERHREEVVIRVRDDGMGIPATALPKVFDIFCRTQDAEAHGLGLGLALVRRLVELHGGSVSAHSAGSQHGSEFVVRLPALPAASPARESSPSQRETAARRIVVVDDNEDVAGSFAMLLGSLGHDVQTAFTGAKALEIVRRQRPELLFVDIDLPDMPGDEVARRLRTELGPNAPRLVALTGYGAREMEQLRASFDLCLLKPVDMTDLEDVLASLPGPSGVRGAG